MIKPYYIIILIMIASTVVSILHIDYKTGLYQSRLSYDILFSGLIIWIVCFVMGKGLWNKK